MKNLIKSKKAEGFTIIEVMIVLAIAGLIMVVVFIAVPQLQRQQRNEARKSVVRRVATEVNNYASNNTGSIPTADANATTGFTGVAGGFYTRYISNNAAQFNDPQSGAIMTFVSQTTVANINAQMAAAGTANSEVDYAINAVCAGEQAAPSVNARNFVVMNKLEGNAVQCIDNR
jgi:prepilin-type N-terminal cleavage/methylation domain-containing protein